MHKQKAEGFETKMASIDTIVEEKMADESVQTPPVAKSARTSKNWR
jgi:hypothetical protein